MKREALGSMTEWLCAVVNCLVAAHSHISIIRERKDKRSYFVILLAATAIDECRVGVRKYVVCGVDTGGADLCEEDIPPECELLHAELGVAFQCLHSDGAPTAGARERLRRLGVLFVELRGDDYPRPDAEYVTPLANILLGGLPLVEAEQALSTFTPDDAKRVSGDQACDALARAAWTTLGLCWGEECVLGPGSASLQPILTSGTGDSSFLSHAYAIKTVPAADGLVNYYMPNCHKMVEHLQRAVSVHCHLLHIQAAEEDAATHAFLRILVSELVKYYGSWLSGVSNVISKESTWLHIEQLREHPHADVMIRRVGDLSEMDQVQTLSLIGAMRIRGATDGILELLPRCGPKAQEVCLQTLSRLGTVMDVQVLTQFAVSPRVAVSEAALELLSNVGTDEAAAQILQLIESSRLPLSEKSVFAMARTNTGTALRFLVNLCAQSAGNVPPMALELCVDYFLPKVERGEITFQGDTEWLLKVCEKLYDAEDCTVLCRRVALKLVRVFRLTDGLGLVAKALRDDSIRTRVAAMACAGAFRDDDLAAEVASSAARPPGGYEEKKLMEWITSSMEVNARRDGRGGALRSREDLDLAKAARKALAEMGAAFLDRHGHSIGTAQESPKEGGEEEQWVSPAETGKTPPVQSVAETEHVYAMPDGSHVWVSYQPGDREPEIDDNVGAVAALIHGNMLSYVPKKDTSAAMLSGGVIATMGTKKEILENIVLPCLRGEEPRLPVSAAMGEFVTRDLKTGERTTVKFDEGKGNGSAKE